jgi:hypothetical protein
MKLEHGWKNTMSKLSRVTDLLKTEYKEKNLGKGHSSEGGGRTRQHRIHTMQ